MSEQTEPACEPVSPRLRLAMSIVALTLAMVAAWAFAAFPVYAHRVQQHFGISEARLGLLLSAGAIGSLFSLLLVGPAIDRLGVRRMLQVCLAGTGVAFLVCGLGRGLGIFQLGLMLSGFFGAAQAVSLPTFLICRYPRRQRRMVTIGLISLAVPGAAFPMLAQWLLSATDAGALDFAAALHGPFLIAGAILVVGPLLLTMGREDDGRADEERPTLSLRGILTVPALLIILCATLHAGADNALYGWLPKFLESRYATLPIGTVVMLGLYSAAYAISRLVLAALPEGTGQRAFLVLPGPIGGALLIAVIWLGGPLEIAIVYPLVGLLIAVEYPTLLAEIRESSAARFSAIYGASIWVSSLVTIASLNLIGRLGERTGDLRIGLTIATLGFVGFGVVALVSGMGRRAAGAGSDCAEVTGDA